MTAFDLNDLAVMAAEMEAAGRWLAALDPAPATEAVAHVWHEARLAAETLMCRLNGNRTMRNVILGCRGVEITQQQTVDALMGSQLLLAVIDSLHGTEAADICLRAADALSRRLDRHAPRQLEGGANLASPEKPQQILATHLNRAAIPFGTDHLDWRTSDATWRQHIADPRLGQPDDLSRDIDHDVVDAFLARHRIARLQPGDTGYRLLSGAVIQLPDDRGLRRQSEVVAWAKGIEDFCHRVASCLMQDATALKSQHPGATIGLRRSEHYPALSDGRVQEAIVLLVVAEFCAIQLLRFYKERMGAQLLDRVWPEELRRLD